MVILLFNQLRNQTWLLDASGVTTLGRNLFECHDKRVSKKHGELTVDGLNVRLKSCHNNPIFYKLKGNLQHQILAKDSEVVLSNLDKFSLLPNEFEYEIRVVKDEKETRAKNSSESDQESISNPLEETINAVRNYSERADPERTPSPEFFSALLDVNGGEGPSNRLKRSMSKQNEADESTKKSKPSSPETLTNTNDNRPNPNPTLPENDFPMQATKIKPDPDGPTAASGSLPVTVDASKVKPDPVAPPSSAVQQETSPLNDLPLLTIKIKPDPDGPVAASGSLPVTVDASKVKPVPVATASSAVKQETSPVNPPQADTSLRPSCQHGIRCYRNTADHRRDIAHPLDQDYRRPEYPSAPMSAPPCPFGISCYRRNPDHFLRLSHPPSTQYSNQPVPAPNAILARQAQDAIEMDFSDEGSEFDNSENDQNYQVDDVATASDDGEENNLEE